MTRIGRVRPFKSQVEAARADSTSGSSSSRSESDLAAGEGSQSFDSVLERMRSGPQDRTAGAQPAANSGYGGPHFGDRRRDRGSKATNGRPA